MNRKVFGIAAALLSGAMLGALERPVVGAETAEMRLKSTPLLTLPETGWKCVYADDEKFAAPDFDDSAWAEVRINAPLSGANRPRNLPENYRQARSMCWYRRSFILPEGVAANNFELRMGQISAGDETYINGRKIGSFGFAARVNGSSTVDRIYVSSGAEPILRPGRNVIAVRCKIGFLRGMHKGKVELRRLEQLHVVGRLTHRSAGPTALARQIAGKEELNRFTPGETVYCRPEIALFSDSPTREGTLVLRFAAAGRPGWRKELPLTLKAGQWVSPAPEKLPELPTGSGDFSAEFISGGRTLWQCRVPVTVAPAEPFSFPADPEAARESGRRLLPVNRVSYGSFGPRDVDKNNRLFDDYSRPDTRGGPVWLAVTGPKYPGAAPALSPLRPMPRPVSLKQVSHTIGGRFDHLTDMWIPGEVVPPGGAVGKPATEAVWWTGRSIRYSYPGGGSFTLTLSSLTPALVFEAEKLPSLLFFAPNRHRTGTPSRLLLPRDGKLRSAVSGKPDAGWLLLSFAGAAGYDEFDLPMLMVFERPPKQVKLIAKGLRVYFDGAASGRIYVMPLYGVTPHALNLGPDAFARAEKWARILPRLPERVTRSAAVDYDRNRLIFQDRYFWRDGRVPADALLPVPPTLLLARRGGMKLAASRPVADLDLATMAGPFAAASGGDTVTWILDGVAHFVREVRQTTEIPDTPETRLARARLAETVRKLAPQLEQHPWPFLAKAKGKGEIGGMEPGVSNLLLALEYLPEATRRRLHTEIVKELPFTILNDDARIPGRKPGTSVPVNTKVTSPLSGRTFSMLTRHCRDNGIDCPCWEALRLCLYERIGRLAGADAVLKKHWEQITFSYNPIVNSHDWAWSVSWDSYGGLRVGNGFQENTIFHAGLIAYARLAHRFGMPEERDRAAYCALMQLIGTKVCASDSTSDYLRRVRPLLAAKSDYPVQERLEALRPHHHLEVNERTGLYHTIINAERAYDNPGFIMTRLPEIMRPFREVWGDFTAAHLNFVRGDGLTISHRNPPNVDHFMYLTDRRPFPLEELIARRLAPDFRRTLPLWQQLADDRAILESYGKTIYRRLW